MKQRGGVTRYDTFADLLAQEFPTREFIIEGMIPATGFTVLSGKAKAGKSTLILEFLREVCVDVPGVLLKEFSVPRQRKVLVVQADCPIEEWQEQVRKIAGPLDVATIDVPWHWLATYMKGTVHEMITETNPDWVIFDALNSSIPMTLDINTSFGMSEAIRMLSHTAGPRPWLALAHMNKDQDKVGTDRVTGHHILTTKASSILTLDRQEGDKGILRIAGRFQKPREKVRLHQDPETGRWSVDTPPSEAQGAGAPWSD